MRNFISLIVLASPMVWAQTPGSTSSAPAVPVNQPSVPASGAATTSPRPSTTSPTSPKPTVVTPEKSGARAKPVKSSPAVEVKAPSGPTLSMKEYFTQVGGNNPAYRAAKEAYEGAKKRVNESKLLYVPELNAFYEDGMTEKVQTQPNFAGRRTDTTIYNISIMQNTPIGLKGTLSYGNRFVDTQGTLSSVVPVPRYYEVTPSIELSQSLWRNGFGSETRSQEALYKAQSNLALYGERLKLEGVRIEAEKTYNRLFFAREALVARKDSYDVANKIYSWAKGRAANELGDDSDAIQARAAQELRQLEVLKAEDEVREANRAFNSLRGINSDEVTDDLEDPQPVLPTKFDYNAAVRSDELRLAEANLKLAEAQGKLQRESLTPTLDVYGKYSLNGLDPQTAGASGTSREAENDAWNGDHPAYSIGIRFRAPLFWWLPVEVKRGYNQQIEAAGLRLKRESQEAERDQINLLARLQNTQKRYELARKLQLTQKDQLERERLRHRRGRTTLFQVLQFEEQYVNSRLNVIQYQNELLNQVNDLSLYRGEN